MNNDWTQDSRLKNMNPEKLKFITDFAQKVKTTPKDQLMSTLLTLNLEASKKGIRFSDQETELLISILSADMSPADRKKMDALKLISQKLSRRS